MGDGRRAPAAGKPHHGDADDDPDELGVFAAERYFYGDDALWCGRSSSSLSSAFRTGTGTIEHDRSVPTPTAATSSSEASWNSRSALLPNEPPPADKLRAIASGAAGALAVEAEPPSGAESERTGRRRASSTSSNNLRRWLLGVAGCACAGGDGDGEESVSADEMEASGDVLGACGEKCNSDARRLSPRTELILEPAFEEAAAVTVRPGSGRWLLDGYRVLPGRDAFSPIEIAGHGHRRSANLVEMSTPAVLHPAATGPSYERRRVKSWEKFMPLGPATQQNSAFTIVAGNAPRTAGGGGGGSLGSEDDSAAPSELGCAYPPSEASVVWSVVTADGAASGNFSSAASGYYYHYFSCGEGGGSLRHAAAAKSDRRRKSGIATTTTSLLACMSDKAVNAVGPAQSVHRPEVEPAVAAARLGARGGSRNGHGGGYNDVIRRRVGR
ncbi:hypothetical protein SETIT_3G079300v2 [Setaria italica]|uniref:Uncharacterized protein n=1 Tax=Setaria italica TaxID=4555 RepID=A0A368QEL8_SETIT|nr:uncharacterized protein LOC101785617 [Setaria italica]RCV15710.1 hypothetical protein SETIT_3G079300v2 [Setaria italica]